MISVIIPVYKNRDSFLSNLRHNTPYLKDTEIIIVNDDPSESLKNDLRQFKDITLIENSSNLGFGSAIHVGVKKAKHKLVMLLNSDVLLLDTSYTKAISPIEKDPSVFAISFAQREKNGTIVGKNSIYWKNGFFHHKKADNTVSGINGWAEGGACIFSKKRYDEIGGFDPLYTPFYWEDVDLSYRAWKRGYKILFEKNILVEHHHESTIKTYFSGKKIQTIAYRNQLIFIWKNMNDFNMLFSHILHLLIYIPIYLFKNQVFISGLFQALLQLPNIMNKRKQYPLNDKQILNQFL